MAGELVPQARQVWQALWQLSGAGPGVPDGVTAGQLAAHTGLPLAEVTMWLTVLENWHLLCLQSHDDLAAVRAIPYRQPSTEPATADQPASTTATIEHLVGDPPAAGP